MSHFTVLVVGKEPEEKLTPYQENNNGDCPEDYLVFEDNEEEYLGKYKTDTRKFWQAPSGERYTTWDERFKVKNEKGTSSHVRPADYVEIEVPFSEIYSTFEDYMDDYVGSKRDKKTGKYGYWENPNAKWDWYTIGGRWAGFFKLKSGANGQKGEESWTRKISGQSYPEGHADQALKRDIDFDAKRNEEIATAEGRYDQLARLLGGEVIPLQYMWKDILEGETFKDKTTEEKREIYWNQPAFKKIEEVKKIGVSDEDKSFLVWLDYEKYLGTKEEYLKRASDSALSTFAVVMDGKWYQRGEMGWWGIVTDVKDEWDKEFTKLLNAIADDELLTVFDCHI